MTKNILTTFILSLAILISCQSNISQDIKNTSAIEMLEYFYPIVLFDYTTKKLSNVAKPTGKFAPINAIGHMTDFPAPDERIVVRPNFDTLYSQSVIDVTNEPILFSYPTINDRYFVFPFLDAWSNVFYNINSVDDGSNGQTIAFVAPNWQGTLPEGVKKVVAPTNQIWLIGRIAAGKKDVEIVRSLQSQMKLYPLSFYNNSDEYIAPSQVDTKYDMRTAPVDAVQALSAQQFLTMGINLAKKLGTLPNDKAFLNKMKQNLHIDISQNFDFDTLPTVTKQALEQALPAFYQKMKTYWSSEGNILTKHQGWMQQLSPLMGNYGTNYLFRAVIAWQAYGANTNKIAIYDIALTDIDSQPLSAKNAYVVHFEPGQLPPNDRAFWSVTVYDQQGFHIANSLNRFSINSMNSLDLNSDGSLDIYLQKDNPGAGKLNNWLPIDGDQFNLMLRIYNPGKSYFDHTWPSPQIRRIS